MASPGPDSNAGPPAGVWIRRIYLGHGSSVQRAREMSSGPSGMLDSPNETLETILPAPQSQHIAHRTVSPCHIFRLPVELLVLVFIDVIMSVQAYYGSHRGRPFNLGRVCRQWRDLVVHTPYLWSVVDYTIRDLSTPEAEERVVASLRLHIERSSPLPLDVAIRLSATPLQDESNLWPTISTLFRRASAFRFSTGVGIHAVLTSQVLPQHAPFLKCFTFEDNDYDKDIEPGEEMELALDAPLLQLIKYQGAPVRFPLQSYPSVCNVSFHTSSDEPSRLIDQIRRFHNVVDLDIACHERNFVAPGLTPMVLAHLETLRINGIDSLLIHDDIAQSFSCPSLRSAKLHGTCDDYNNGLVVAPSAVTLFMQSALQTVRALELNLALSRESSDAELVPAVVEGLVSCAQLEHLAYHIHTGVGIIAALSTPQTDGTWVCPRLHTLSVHISYRVLDDEPLRGEAVKLAIARQGTGLKKIEVLSGRMGDTSDWLPFQGRLDQILSTESVVSLDDSGDEI
ncbi:hypothetical protein EXIGLDRAFT_723689 [Exidia glandulosa HHB12029]|uniref:Uncharacterized protein n=1 Tax=Exidia glandulosa HHB12029 TaxID=1314781 RepID=A0A165EQE8_EXIGL|nr:hypothetical protein EXIGLDRAFT_723689 [Exidia glandulosa HHB12029]